jgi:hypothetical protein
MKKTTSYILLSLLTLFLLVSCKAKKCATFDGDNGGKHVNYDKKGLVKKKKSPGQRNWGL